MNKKIAKKINKMAKIDQEACKTGTFNLALAKKNTDEMKKIINKFGWPSTKLVGKKASHFAWLLVQHADHDVKFQKNCLALMEKNTIDWAYLTDRILVNKGKPQIYGTQFYKDFTDKLVPRPIKNLTGLDKRRKSLGLQSFKLYKKQMTQNKI